MFEPKVVELDGEASGWFVIKMGEIDLCPSTAWKTRKGAEEICRFINQALETLDYHKCLFSPPAEGK